MSVEAFESTIVTNSRLGASEVIAIVLCPVVTSDLRREIGLAAWIPVHSTDLTTRGDEDRLLPLSPSLSQTSVPLFRYDCFPQSSRLIHHLF